MLKIVIAFGLFLSLISAHANEIDLARLQTAFIEKMIHYVEWPDYTDESFNIAFYHDNRELLTSLRSIEDKIVFGKSIKINENEKLKKFQMIILKSTHSQKLTLSRGVLIITDDPEGLSEDSMINFYLEDGKLKFDINNTLAQEKGLRINSRLLKLARHVK